MKAGIILMVAALALAACSPSQPEATANNASAADRAAMGHDMAAPGDSAATRGLKASMAGMMTAAPPYTGNADHDFMAQMRVHHVAAVEMARVELEHGKDEEARALAQAVIAAQEAEIAQIDRWLAARKR